MTEEKSEKPPLFELLDDLRFDKKNLLKINEIKYESEYSPFLVNRFLSSNVGNIFYIQDINMWARSLSKRQQYDYLIASIPKNKKWLQYPKKEKNEKLMEYIMKLFSYSREKAETAIRVLTEEQKIQIVEKFERHLEKRNDK